MHGGQHKWIGSVFTAAHAPYHRAIDSTWMISAIAGIYGSAYKADCALIRKDQHGIRKSSTLMMIAKPWFAGRLSGFNSRNAAIEMRGIWIIEVAEFDRISPPAE